MLPTNRTGKLVGTAPFPEHGHGMAGIIFMRTSGVGRLTSQRKDARLTAIGLLDEIKQANHVDIVLYWKQLGRLAACRPLWMRAYPGLSLIMREETYRVLGALGAQQLGSVAHVMAKSHVPNQGAWMALWTELAHAATALVHDLNPQALANMAWAYATVGHAAPALLEAVAGEAARRVAEFKPHDLAAIIWAYAKLGHVVPALFEGVAAELVCRTVAGRLYEFSSQALVKMIWAYGAAKHLAPLLLQFEPLALEVAERAHTFDPQDVADMVRAYAIAGHVAPALFEALAHRMAGSVRELNPQALANIAWGYALANVRAESLFGDGAFAECCELVAGKFGTSELHQLHQWDLWCSEQEVTWRTLSPMLLERCRDATWMLFLRTRTMQSSRPSVSPRGSSDMDCSRQRKGCNRM
uniref:FAST kinase leucine-rich domain-containing protein n=1 Tax=Coccolithus braarudii TaxID=221442 RepID=A0A7S0PV46_9EUKA|mmetsp:Transcript_15007/g.32588  ORF Transcript_15007/g.32588 Transcript_15007/m.32588 type:complete len:412 (+) Transcript_15007:189-1424(+)